MPGRNPRYIPPIEFACRAACSVSLAARIQKQELRPELESSSNCMILLDLERRFMEVSDGSCKLTGYSRGQLIGLKHDELIAPDTAEIGKPNDPFTMTGCSEGLWLLVCREGTRILVHYESHMRIDYLLQIEIRVIGAGY